MKTLSFLALSALASTAMAGVVTVASTPDITINGTSTQSASLTSMSVNNHSTGSNSEAFQNLASNTGNVTINGGGSSTQSVYGYGGSLTNTASGSQAYASQNLSSNVGDVTINGSSSQYTTMMNSHVANLSSGSNSKAVQNIASNNACFTCQPTKPSSPHH